MADVPGRDVSISGMTEPEAREFHSIFVTSFIAFTVVALIAHVLVWHLASVAAGADRWLQDSRWRSSITLITALA